MALGYAANTRDVYSPFERAVVHRRQRGVGAAALGGLHFLLSALLSLDIEAGLLLVPGVSQSGVEPSALLRVGLGVHFR